MVEQFDKLEKQFYEIINAAGPTILRNLYKIKRKSKKGFEYEPEAYDKFTFKSKQEKDTTYEVINHIVQQKIEVVIRKPFEAPLSFDFPYVFGMFTDLSSQNNQYLSYYTDLKTFIYEFTNKIS